jgi:hypothetical protein
MLRSCEPELADNQIIVFRLVKSPDSKRSGAEEDQFLCRYLPVLSDLFSRIPRKMGTLSWNLDQSLDMDWRKECSFLSRQAMPILRVRGVRASPPNYDSLQIGWASQLGISMNVSFDIVWAKAPEIVL